MSSIPHLRHVAAAAVLTGSLAGFASSPVLAAGIDPGLISRGEYLARAGDCIACHTAPGGQPFAGGLMMDTPFGKISTPNITPDKATGIGDWSDDDFYRAVHEGIGHKGEYLYPVFPFPWYTKVRRDDVVAIKAYLFSLAPVDAPRKPLQLMFPFNVREALLTWRTAFFKPGEFQPDPSKSAEVNHGAYLVEGLGHCGECHNHNNILGASDWSGRLKGGEIEGWYAPNITSDGKEGIGRWNDTDLVAFLHDGVAPGHGVALGPMKETIDDSLHYMSDADLHAMVAYLKSFAPQQSYQPTDQNQAQTVAATGGSTYLTFCSSCHGVEGKGVKGMIPALAGNGAVMAQGPQDMIRVVVGGLEATNGLAPMPAVGVGMTDQQVADAINYARTAWGNSAPGNAKPGDVASLRPKTQTPMSVQAADQCTQPIAGPQLAKAITDSGFTQSLANVQLANMLAPIDGILPKIKAGAPDAKDDDIVNAMTAAYCPIAMGDASLPPADRTALMGNFASLVYGQIKRTEAAHDGPVKN